MRAAVYRGPGSVAVEDVPVPQIGPGEALVRVEACGICGTDLKKIAYGLVPPPRIFGHEIAGVIEQLGPGVTEWAPGDRVVVVHHVPCRSCGPCRRGDHAQCATFRQTGTTAGFEPAGGGMAEYVRVMDWVVQHGMTRIPDRVSYETASFLEPVNTCLKAVRKARPREGSRTLVLGQGSIGLLLLQLARLEGARVFGADLLTRRLAMSRRLGAEGTVNPSTQDLESQVHAWTKGQGMDVTLVAAASPQAVDQALRVTRPGGRVLLFAQTQADERAEVNLGAICVQEKDLLGSYSSSIYLNAEVEKLVFSGRLKTRELITHRFGLEDAPEALKLAAEPRGDSLKVVLYPHGPERASRDR